MSAIRQPAGVQRASDLLSREIRPGGVERFLPVASPLQSLLPGLRRGSAVALTPGSHALVWGLLAPVTAAGGWVAVVGMPELGLLAGAQAGVALERLAVVPHPGPQWPAATAALLDGLDAVVVAPPGPVQERMASRLTARARQRGAVLLAYGQWPGADLTLAVDDAQWHGLRAGHGRLRSREVTIVVQGRGAATRPRRARLLLPDPAGRLAAVTASRHGAGAEGARPTLTVVGGAVA